MTLTQGYAQFVTKPKHTNCHSGYVNIKANYTNQLLEHGFPRLGSLRGCERAHVLAVRTCKHLASVHPHVEKVRRMKLLMNVIGMRQPY